MNEQIWKVVKNFKLIPVMLTLILVIAMSSTAFAAPPLQQGDDTGGDAQQGQVQPVAGTCAQEYVIVAGDSLSAIAAKLLGNAQSYPMIVEATNAAGVNNGFAAIEDPNLITVGQTLCIPA